MAGGHGTRLYPATRAVCKQLLPVFDKPMIYYPLAILMQAGIREILLISTPEDTPRFQKLFGSGESLGLSFTYKVQNQPKGIAEALLLGEEFLQGEPVALVLGDNLFYGPDMERWLSLGSSLERGGLIYGYEVKDPSAYGVVSFSEAGEALDIEEKPKEPQSRYAIPGLYFYDGEASLRARALKPSSRGELEITDLNKSYLSEGLLRVEVLPRGVAWLDTGTFDALQKASSFVQAIQERQGIQIACLEEIAYRQGYIDDSQLEKLSREHKNNEYGAYLSRLCQNRRESQKHAEKAIFTPSFRRG